MIFHKLGVFEGEIDRSSVQRWKRREKSYQIWEWGGVKTRATLDVCVCTNGEGGKFLKAWKIISQIGSGERY